MIDLSLLDDDPSEFWRELEGILRPQWVDEGIAYDGPSGPGYHPEWRVEVQPEELKADVGHAESIPTTLDRVLQWGGCDGEHGGPCGRQCREVEVPYSFQLSEVNMEKGRLVAIYDLES